MSRFILALDQGTTSSRAILFDAGGRIVSMAQQEFEQLYPLPSHVEHDPESIWGSQIAVAENAMQKAGVGAKEVAALGIANQRETTLLWERKTGKPVANAIVWQSRISADLCSRLKADGLEPTFHAKTGLVIDAYFSGTKIRYLLDSIAGLRQRAENGEILFGTVDSYLVWRMTGGTRHITDVSNASRTLLFNIHSLTWDEDLLEILRIPRAMLPEVRPSSEIYDETTPDLFGAPIPIAGIAGDQQAATFGQACFKPGDAKNTYGTGCFLLLNTGKIPIKSQNNLLTTIGWQIGDEVTYCLEGSVFIAGEAIQWLRDGLGIIATSAEVERLAGSVPDSSGVYFVPAFVGLGAPYWDSYARGTILGITRSTQRGHLARAAIEAMAYQSRDVLDAMQQDAGLRLTALKVDGGAAVNNLLLQFQADIIGSIVHRPVVAETTALGAAYLAGLAVGYWKDTNELAANWALDREFVPQRDPASREQLYGRWKRAVARSLAWEQSNGD